MARSTNKIAQNKAVFSNELKLEFNLPNGKVITLGYLALFENNNLHNQISKLTDEQLANLPSKLTCSIVEAGTRSETSELDLGL
ncbi:hypothetical protein [Moraxella nonliquefaciens]|uniref:Uncharacterized protein n=1 Tax=Moraxella nonliquefaciens TaxID=478 RepID=A0A1B8QTB9_MORNO|nr:hypothetical protein [Moraxella nonliquefaciens]OBX88388.1 hypothetical protein A7456_00555 [Moraxella nonliquefaciens]QPT44554.1 hypothetical protein I6G26_11085 [Moraxella nonliquefaciens]QQC29574.1 hypothetical protein I6H63_09865 [Moraxella nonliquefaciens]